MVGLAVSTALLLSLPAAAQNRPAPEALPMEELRTLASVYSMLRAELAKEPDARVLLKNAIQGMARGADPQNEYYDAEAFKEFRAGSSRGDQSSVGVEVRAVAGNHLVLHPLSGGPAAEAGVQFGDVLHAVDGKRTSQMTPHQVFTLLQGPQGSRVALTVFRESSLTVEAITVERKQFILSKPSLERTASGAVVLRVNQFQESTLQDAANLLAEAWQKERYRGIVLDLRGSPGGLLDIAIGVATMFLPQGATVAATHGRLPESNFVYKASPEFYMRRGGADPLRRLPADVRTLPLAVLIDEGTAAGAEIVAAALQDYQRAVLIGRRTFGRASIQTVRPLSPTEGLKYTTSYWFTPTGKSIHEVGVKPDIDMAVPRSSPQVMEEAARHLPAR